MNYRSKVLFALPENVQEQLNIQELRKMLALEMHFKNWDEFLYADKVIYDLAVLYCDENSYDEFIDGLEVLSSSGALPFNRFILVTPRPLGGELLKAWQLGMSCHVAISESLECAYHAIEAYCTRSNENLALRQQLNEASEIALLAMSASSQLGDVIKFLEKSYSCESYQSLGDLLVITLEQMGIHGCGVIRSCGREFYFGEKSQDLGMRDLLFEQKDKSRIVDVKEGFIVNYEAMSLLVESTLEPGTEAHGRLKDTIAILVEGAEACIKNIVISQLAQASEHAKSVFISLVSHELGTPMNSLLGFTSLLERKNEGEVITKRDREAIGYINANSKRLMNLISDILDLAETSSNPIVDRRRHNVFDYLVSILKEAKTEASLKGIELTIDVADKTVEADVDLKRLQQIVKRLLANAIKNTEEGKVNFLLKSVQNDEGMTQILMKVRDSGPGLTPGQRDVIFEPFAIGEDLLTRVQDGAGLSLVIVKEYIHELGGDVTLNSESGNEFTALFPQYIPTQANDEGGKDIELF